MLLTEDAVAKLIGTLRKSIDLIKQGDRHSAINKLQRLTDGLERDVFNEKGYVIDDDKHDAEFDELEGMTPAELFGNVDVSKPKRGIFKLVK